MSSEYLAQNQSKVKLVLDAILSNQENNIDPLDIRILAEKTNLSAIEVTVIVEHVCDHLRIDKYLYHTEVDKLREKVSVLFETLKKHQLK